MKISILPGSYWMRGACGAVAVLYLGFRCVVPMAGWQHREPAANGHSVLQRTQTAKHVALTLIESHWAPVVRKTRIAIPDGDERLTSLPDGRLPAGAGRGAIPLRI